MSKTDDPERSTPWGTWEELLLACAVNRHGTKSWDSVAMEIQNRTTSPLILTAQNCKQKYHDLQRRFMAVDDETDGGDDESENGVKTKIPWLEELRKLRVAELRREVHRYDVSIVSLQLKVRRLKEERERSLKESENGVEKPDLGKEQPQTEADTGKEKDGGKDRTPPENVAGKRISGDESDRENQSFNESNSTDPKDKSRGTDVDKKPEEDAGKPDPVSGDSPGGKAAGEGSYNGSSDTVAKGAAVEKSPAPTPTPTPAPEAGESAEFRESVAESKGEGVEGAKESSDVQSSASLSRKKRRMREVSGHSSAEEPEAGDISPISKRISAKSQPSVSFLEIVRSHKHGSVFERRLESQDSADYRRLIRQHVDLQTVKMKLEEGLYNPDSILEFFRDLLLLFNNAIVFFAKGSTEHNAAVALRAMVSKEMARSIPKPCLSSKEATPPPPPSHHPSLIKSNSELAASLPGKPNSTGPLIACRKRSSISAKASSAEIKRKEATESEKKPDTAAEAKEPDNASVSVVAEPRITKKRTMDRSAMGTRGTRTSKARTTTTATATAVSNSTKTSNANLPTAPSPSTNSNAVVAKANESPEGKAEKKNPNPATVAKKRSAANFLNRMKRSLLSSNGTLLETLKSSAGSGGGNSSSRATETKKGGSSSGGKGDGRKEQAPRQGTGGKQTQQEHNSPVAAKRSVGRPPKRAAAATAAAASAPQKRAKEAAAAETESKPPPRKRTRR